MSHPLEGQCVEVVRPDSPTLYGPVRIITVASEWLLLAPLSQQYGASEQPRWVPTVQIAALFPVTEPIT